MEGNAAWSILPQRRRKARTFETTDTRAAVSSKCYEYLDHTADVQLHAWGDTMEEAFRNVALCMFGYMTNLDEVETEPGCRFEIQVQGHDECSLLYEFLSEWVYLFGTKDFIACQIEFVQFDMQAFKIHAIGTGALFDLKKHEQGTEIKAITYSNMQICEAQVPIHLYVIVDI